MCLLSVCLFVVCLVFVILKLRRRSCFCFLCCTCNFFNSRKFFSSTLILFLCCKNSLILFLCCKNSLILFLCCKNSLILFLCCKNSSQFCAQVVAVLSAMKMEMAVQAPIGGKVTMMMTMNIEQKTKDDDDVQAPIGGKVVMIMMNNKQKMMMTNNK